MWVSRFFPIFVIAGILVPLFVFALGVCRRFARVERLFSAGGLALSFIMATSTGTVIFTILWFFFPENKILPPIVLFLFFAWGLFLLRPRGYNQGSTPTIPNAPACSWQVASVIAGISLLMLLAVAFPLKQIGAASDDGGYAYRLYFSSDYLKHVAMVEEVVKGELPPRNPYFTPETLHYYWLFYVIPAAFTYYGVPALQSLVGYHLLIGLCVMMALWFLCLCWSDGRISAVWLFAIMLTGPSLEGLYIFYRFGHEMNDLVPFISQYNIDAITRWYFGHPQFDSMYRAMIYTPQHLFAVLCLCVVLMLFNQKNVPGGRSPAQLVMQGTLIAIAFLSSAIIGTIMSIWFCVTLLQWWLRSSCSLRATLTSVLAGLPVVIAVLLAVVSSMVSPHGSSFLTVFPALKTMFMIIMLNFGWIVPIAVVSLILAFSDSIKLWREWLLLCVSLGLGFFVQIKDFPTDIGLKAGLVVIIAFGAPAGLTLSRLFQVVRRPLFRFCLHIVLAIVVVSSLPTLLIDVFNSSDTDNRSFTSIVTVDEMAACRWMRTHLPSDAVIQANPHSGEAFWSLIPTFAARRTAVGDEMHSRIFQVEQSDYVARKDEVTNAFATFNPLDALTRLQRLSIDYICIGSVDRSAYRHALTKFESCPHFFTNVFQQGNVSIYKIRKRSFTMSSVRDIADGPLELDVLNPSSVWPLMLRPIIGDTISYCPTTATPHDIFIAPGRKETKIIERPPGWNIDRNITQRQFAISFPIVLTYNVGDLHSQTGSRIMTDNGDTIIRTLRDRPGFVLYGPYEFFPISHLRIACHIQAVNGGGPPQEDELVDAGRCDVHAPLLKKVLIERSFTVQDIVNTPSVILDVVLDKPTMLEFRLYSPGNAGYETRGFTVEVCEEPLVMTNAGR